MSRLIDLDDDRNCYIGMDGEYERWNIDPDVLEEARQELQWIPCSERLPEPENEEQRRGFYLTTNERGSVGVNRYEFYDDSQKTGWQIDIGIDAWMPLPKPWRRIWSI